MFIKCLIFEVSNSKTYRGQKVLCFIFEIDFLIGKRFENGYRKISENFLNFYKKYLRLRISIKYNLDI